MHDISQKEFSHFFLFVGYDTISERLLHGRNEAQAVPGKGDGSHKMQYRKFVQGHKDTRWAKEVLSAVDKVNHNKDLYRQYIPLLEQSNMGALAKICTNVGSSIMPPTRRAHGMQKCIITNIIMDGCIELHRAGRTNDKQQHDNTMYVGQRFQHFLYMLWTVSRIENLVKHYVHEWLLHWKIKCTDQESMQDVIESFTNDSQSFCTQLHAIFGHAVLHVCTSLDTHLSLQRNGVEVAEFRQEAKRHKKLPTRKEGNV